MQPRILPALLVAALLTAAAPYAAAAPIPYTYTLIAEGTFGAGTSFLNNPGVSVAINNDGTVAFVGTKRAGGTAIFTGSGGALTAVVQSGATFSGFSQIPQINDSGRVGFIANLTGGGAGVFTAAAGGPVTTITQGAGTISSFGTNASINNNGAMAFATSSGLFSGNGGALTTVLASSATVGNLGPIPDINDLGAISFAARIGNKAGIFRIANGVITTISNQDGPYSPFYATGPTINDDGTVFFGGTLDANFPNVNQLALGSGGPITPVIDATSWSNGNFSGVINEHGDVAFWTGIDSGDAGIFTGDDLIDDVVVRTGQALFGSTIVQMSPPGNDFFNDHGDVAFLARLADGRFVVARANAPRIAAPVPEPGAASVAVALATLLALRRRRVQSAAGTNM